MFIILLNNKIEAHFFACKLYTRHGLSVISFHWKQNARVHKASCTVKLATLQNEINSRMLNNFPDEIHLYSQHFDIMSSIYMKWMLYTFATATYTVWCDTFQVHDAWWHTRNTHPLQAWTSTQTFTSKRSQLFTRHSFPRATHILVVNMSYCASSTQSIYTHTHTKYTYLYIYVYPSLI